MIVEHALLPVRPELTAAFEAAFAEARPLIASMPGFRSLTLSHCVEAPGTYLLLVEWERLSDHVDGFRRSPEYQQWKALLHHFYEPFPVVQHFEPVRTEPISAPPPAVTASAPNAQ
ncbi:antibiotic biosynthesis monooxygenase [Nocardia sp. NPDC050713]|uniref:antibiotic biosynthesis monooxygenase family protein n=1 Tax=Nocardia sp. NPDC050713 TaxID=3154511 RepID=UPI00340384C8